MEQTENNSQARDNEAEASNVSPHSELKYQEQARKFFKFYDDYSLEGAGTSFKWSWQVLMIIRIIFALANLAYSVIGFVLGELFDAIISLLYSISFLSLAMSSFQSQKGSTSKMIPTIGITLQHFCSSYFLSIVPLTFMSNRKIRTKVLFSTINFALFILFCIDSLALRSKIRFAQGQIWIFSSFMFGYLIFSYFLFAQNGSIEADPYTLLVIFLSFFYFIFPALIVKSIADIKKQA